MITTTIIFLFLFIFTLVIAWKKTEGFTGGIIESSVEYLNILELILFFGSAIAIFSLGLTFIALDLP